MSRGVGIRSQNKDATAIDGQPSQFPVKILTPRETVDFQGNAILGAGGKNSFPSSAQAGPVMEVAGPRVGQNMNVGGRDSSQ